MILRSQLRMNKSIVFPFIGCIMIVFTLLVLIHKSVNEVNAVKKELALCKQQQDSVYTQLQSAIEYKLRLEKSLENEKNKEKQKIDELQNILNQEKEDRRKEKEDADNRFDALNQRYNTVESAKNELNENNEKNRMLLVAAEEGNAKLSNQLKAVRLENEKLLSSKDEIIEDLREKLKKLENSHLTAKSKGVTPESRVQPLINERVDLVQSSSKGSTTPQINPQALVGHEDSPKQVGPPPNVEQESSLQKAMRKSLDMRPDTEPKPDENVINAPQVKTDDEKERNQVNNELSQRGDYKNQPNIMPPLPYRKVQSENKASSASNNAAERGNQPEDQQDVLQPPDQNAVPNEKEKPKEIQKQIMKDYVAREDYVDKDPGEAEDGEDNYMDKNDIRPMPAGPKTD